MDPVFIVTGAGVGRYTNHSASPTAEAYAGFNGDIMFKIIKPLRGYMGGQPVDELTVDYRQVYSVARQADKIGGFA